MVGFTLPRFRWLVAGALVAGGWAMTQDQPAPSRQQAKPPVRHEVSLPSRVAPPPSRSAAARATTKSETIRPPADIVTSSIPRPAPARPKAAVPEVPPVAAAKREPASAFRLPAWAGGKVPARKPQEGDCQCPYDLMVSGKECGAHSAYHLPGYQRPVCYR